MSSGREELGKNIPYQQRYNACERDNTKNHREDTVGTA
jgi:hypothetical protein